MILEEGIVIASGNKNKHSEFSELFKNCKSEIKKIKIIFSDIKIEVEENGKSFFSNAYLKARAWSDKTGFPALADDSGIIVRALDWQPGIRSARIVEGTDEERNIWLLKSLDGKADRNAAFVAALVLCDAENGFSIGAEARCGGEVADSPRGNNGFGYDPLFIPNGYKKTFGELDRDIKMKISHRAVALRNLLYMIESKTAL